MKLLSVITLLYALCGVFAQAQTGNASTRGSCSPATTGSENNFVIQCGIGPEQGKKILDLLNAVLQGRSDTDAKLDELLALVLKPAIQLSATLRNPTDPAVQIENKSDRTANAVSWEVVLYREGDLALFSFPTTDMGYQKARSKGNLYQLGLTTKQKFMVGGGDSQIKNGDIFTGSISLDCPDCAGVTDILHLVWGESGWFCELTGLPGARVLMGRDMTPEGKKKWIQTLYDSAPPSCRVPIQ